MTLATFDRIWSNYEVTKFNLKQVEKQNIFNKKQVLPTGQNSSYVFKNRHF